MWPSSVDTMPTPLSTQQPPRASPHPAPRSFDLKLRQCAHCATWHDTSFCGVCGSSVHPVPVEPTICPSLLRTRFTGRTTPLSQDTGGCLEGYRCSIWSCSRRRTAPSHSLDAARPRCCSSRQFPSCALTNHLRVT